MNTGQIISGAGHAGLICWALLGGFFQSAPAPFQVTEVTAISTEEYAALIAPQQAPDAVSNVATPEPPAPGDMAPDLSSTADDAPDVAQPDVADTPPLEEAPDVTEISPPVEAEVSDEPPVLEPPSEDVAVLVPEISPRPQPRPAPRVAPEPVAQPEPDVKIDDVDQPKAEPSDKPDEVVKEDKPETAREEATTKIVTEAEKVANAAPSKSVRPRTRPAAPKPEQTAKPADTKPTTDSSSVNNALAEALGAGQSNTGKPGGPPLTHGEKDALRVAVQQCWNVGSLSSEALNTTVVVSVAMTENGKPKSETIRMLSSSGGTGNSAQQAFEAAKRAIIRCAKSGYGLPRDKYDHWRDIEMTFNPENMRIK